VIFVEAPCGTLIRHPRARLSCLPALIGFRSLLDRVSLDLGRPARAGIYGIRRLSGGMRGRELRRLLHAGRFVPWVAQDACDITGVVCSRRLIDPDVDAVWLQTLPTARDQSRLPRAWVSIPVTRAGRPVSRRWSQKNRCVVRSDVFVERVSFTTTLDALRFLNPRAGPSDRIGLRGEICWSPAAREH